MYGFTLSNDLDENLHGTDQNGSQGFDLIQAAD